MKAETKQTLLTAVCRSVLFWVYSILGALIFMEIEGNHADSRRNDKSLYEEIKRNLTAQYNINETAFDEVTKKLEEASQVLYTDAGSNWSFGNSLLFVQSIVTTIGYGHITPVTILGRMVCIVYAIFGIPICLAMLAVVGDAMRIGHMTWIQKVEKRFPLNLSCDSKCVIVCTAQMVLLILIGAAIHMELDNWTLDEGIYAWFITFSTIGFGDLIPGYKFLQGEFDVKHSILIYRVFFDIFGLCVVAALLSSLARILQRCKCQKMKYCCLSFSDDKYKESELDSSRNERKLPQFGEMPDDSRQ